MFFTEPKLNYVRCLFKMSLQISSVENEFNESLNQQCSINGKTGKDCGTSIALPTNTTNSIITTTDSVSVPTTSVAQSTDISIKIPPTQISQISSLVPNTTPKIIRQQAIDLPSSHNGQSSFQHANSCTNSQNIWLSTTNNSLESNSTTPSLQKKLQQQWAKQQSSINSSIYSNGEIRSCATISRSRRSSEKDLHKESRHRFSLIPQVCSFKSNLFKFKFKSIILFIQKKKSKIYS